jgi:CheY-like chemotaxis protein
MNNEKPFLLLVEDNPADADLVEEALNEAHLEYRLSVMRDGVQAIGFIDRLEANPASPCPVLVLLDLNLPKVSGIEVLNRVRVSPACQTVKVLIISSSNSLADRQLSIQQGASEYFHKPSSLAGFMELGSIVRGLLETVPQG